jgi:hypothetical protein
VIYGHAKPNFGPAHTPRREPRYITRMSPVQGCRVAIYDTDTGFDVAHFVRPDDAEAVKDMWNASIQET